MGVKYNSVLECSHQLRETLTELSDVIPYTIRKPGKPNSMRPLYIHRALCTAVFTILLITMTGGCSDSDSDSESPQTGVIQEPGVVSLQSDPTMNPNSAMLNTPFLMEGVMTPPVFAVDEVSVPDEARVFGVVVADEARAYLRDSMAVMSSHVVNDLLSETPVSITYCDRTENLRGFCGSESGSPLHLSTGGYMENEMTIRLDGVMYPQSSEKIPLQPLVVVSSTWVDWEAAHPGSTIFLGNLADKFSRDQPVK